MHQRKAFTFIFLVLLAGAAAAVEPTKDSLDVVKDRLAKKQALLIDVREQGEWDRGHLADAQLVPLSALKRGANDPAIKDKLSAALAKKQIVYCHCAKGVRALTAGNLLAPQGYDVRPLAFTYEQLLEAGFAPAKK